MFEVHLYRVDLSDSKAINEAAAKAKKEVGDVDILINNAGMVTGKTLLDSPDNMIEKTIAVNGTACLLTAKNFVRSMIARNSGHVVTVASVAGKTGAPGMVDYCASKYAAVGFHDSLAAELHRLGANGVKMTVVCPYFISTGMFEGFGNKSPLLVPNLTPEHVVECIVEAVLTNQHEVFIPKVLYWMSLLNFLPTEAKHIVVQYLGQWDSMDTFTGRKSAVTA